MQLQKNHVAMKRGGDCQSAEANRTTAADWHYSNPDVSGGINQIAFNTLSWRLT